jgi:hypothetical protein
MADLFNDFLNTGEGKHYLQNNNNGGGAPGGSKPANAGGMSRQQFDALPYEQQAAYMKAKGVVHN